MVAGDDWISLHQQVSIRCVDTRLRRRGTALSGNLHESATKPSDAVSYPLVLRLLLFFRIFFLLFGLPMDPCCDGTLTRESLVERMPGADVACANRVVLG